MTKFSAQSSPYRINGRPDRKWIFPFEPTHLYIMRAKEREFKLGFSKAPGRRLRELRVVFGPHVELLWVACPLDNGLVIEKAAQRLLRIHVPQLTSGDWFSAEYDQVLEALLLAYGFIVGGAAGYQAALSFGWESESGLNGGPEALARFAAEALLPPRRRRDASSGNRI